MVVWVLLFMLFLVVVLFSIVSIGQVIGWDGWVFCTSQAIWLRRWFWNDIYCNLQVGCKTLLSLTFYQFSGWKLALTFVPLVLPSWQYRTVVEIRVTGHCVMLQNYYMDADSLWVSTSPQVEPRLPIPSQSTHVTPAARTRSKVDDSWSQLAVSTPTDSSFPRPSFGTFGKRSGATALQELQAGAILSRFLYLSLLLALWMSCLLLGL